MSKIVTAPEDVLSSNAEEFDFEKKGKTLPELLDQMETALLSASDPKGVGLAAPQIGKSVAIFMAKPTDKSPISVFINPKVLEQDKLNPKKKQKKSKKA